MTFESVPPNPTESHDDNGLKRHGSRLLRSKCDLHKLSIELPRGGIHPVQTNRVKIALAW